MTKIDPWFLRQMEEMVVLEREMEKFNIHDFARFCFMRRSRKGMEIDKLLTFNTFWESVF